MLQNTPVQRLNGGNPTTGLPRARLVTRPRELSITFKPHCKDKRTASLTTKYGKKTVKRKRKKQTNQVETGLSRSNSWRMMMKLFFSCIVHNQFTTLNQQNAECSSLLPLLFHISYISRLNILSKHFSSFFWAGVLLWGFICFLRQPSQNIVCMCLSTLCR